ncbi:ARM repeat-containing protein [Amylostereum chailletii]|nr:ARM repeat-containing protein [Amylostereum chailletii]
MADLQALLSALDVFSRAPDRDALDKANNWLQDFQHSSEAWDACSLLLSSPEAPQPAKLFAAQTFRTKVTYDLHQVSENNLFSLRDTLVAALEAYKGGPKTIITQLCLALSGLAIQLPTWGNAVQTMIETFGNNAVTVPVLLEFLIVLPEELNSNIKIPITDQDYRERSAQLLTGNASQVLNILTMYIQAAGVTIAVQNQVFRCLKSWLVAGEVSATAVGSTQLFDFAFEALASEQLFDAAADVICDIIHETQEVDDNMPVIERIVPQVLKLRSGLCSAYSDLDIVPITFPFWERLAQSIGKRTSISPLFHEAYKALMNVIIGHLRFPQDVSSLTGQELENFRQFRHVMGDTLKDCCAVLGTEYCLMTALDLISVALSRGPGATWQDVEAPLFAMRSMGAEIDPNDDKAVPRVMETIPSLPQHPRVRYAALLLISRYTRWINLHMDYVPACLQYISAGFEDSDEEVCTAAGHALKYLCEDCKQHLVPFLPQLHTFLGTVGSKLPQEDKMVIYEAISHVISAMPMEQAAQSLRTFALDILSVVHALSAKVSVVTKQELKSVGDGLANLEVMLWVVGPFGQRLPVACQSTCEEAWTVLDAFVLKYGSDAESTERATRTIRHGLGFFGKAALGVAPAVINRMSAAFEATNFSSYLWVASKVIQAFGNEEDPALRASFRVIYEQSTNRLVALLQEKQPALISDILDDYVRMLMELVEYAPDIFFESSAFPFAFRVAMTALTLLQSDIVFATLDLFRIVLTHDCLSPPDALNPTPPPKFPIYANIIRRIVEKEGQDFVALLLTGLVGDFPEDSTSTVIAIVRVLAALWPSALVAWATPVLQGLPVASTPEEAKAQFVKDLTDAINANQPDKVKYAVLGLHRTSRKARERRRMGPLE